MALSMPGRILSQFIPCRRPVENPSTIMVFARVGTEVAMRQAVAHADALGDTITHADSKELYCSPPASSTPLSNPAAVAEWLVADRPLLFQLFGIVRAVYRVLASFDRNARRRVRCAFGDSALKWFESITPGCIIVSFRVRQ